MSLKVNLMTVGATWLVRFWSIAVSCVQALISAGQYEMPVLIWRCTIINAPRCKSDIGIKWPRGYQPYCEDCGWPHEDFEAE
jgi:hypothetical protein